jgi:hypothetical protein
VQLEASVVDAVETRAAKYGVSVNQLVVELLEADRECDLEFEEMERQGEGPWSPIALAEDTRAAEEFERTRMAVLGQDVVAWLRSWGTPNELPMPKPRKV